MGQEKETEKERRLDEERECRDPENAPRIESRMIVSDPPRPDASLTAPRNSLDRAEVARRALMAREK